MTTDERSAVGRAPEADEVTVVCRHGARGRPLTIETFMRESGGWTGACGPLAVGWDHLGPATHARGAGEDKPGDRTRSTLFWRVPGELPVWRGRCPGCARQPRDRRGRPAVRAQWERPGEVLVSLLDRAAAGWVSEVDLFDLANHDGRGTFAELLVEQARVDESWRAEQQL